MEPQKPGRVHDGGPQSANSRGTSFDLHHHTVQIHFLVTSVDDGSAQIAYYIWKNSHLESHQLAAMNSRNTSAFFLMTLIIGLMCSLAPAGMPAPLPSNWTKDNTPNWANTTTTSPVSQTGSMDARLQAISFFVACLLLCAWGVRWLWNSLRKDVTWLPALTYRRSLSLVMLWGLLFVIVLTMISGARELMTPGAWQKQGWTYKLTEHPSTDSQARLGHTERRQALERLRTELWQYAATHQGQFPSIDELKIDADLWNVPGWPDQKFILAPNRHAEVAGRLLVYEPEVDGDERQVLLTNGLIGTMRGIEIHQALKDALPATPRPATPGEQSDSTDN